MEQSVFPTPAVAAELESMIEARLHNDGPTPEEVRRLELEMVDSYATPVYVVVDPASGEQLGVQHGARDFDAEGFAEFLRAAREAAGD
ncbi:MAG: hypothetical protein QF903_10905 [Planctomycetota bacterium]|jgi:hypothetical protein|nr:hypothetical protein [Planctomycetota bacterium]MDP6762669.1 hypothetical protein [Planctomycetota bacterium]MDP6989978.1 hypothetical protein [Planctomycetota bacterium]